MSKNIFKYRKNFRTKYSDIYLTVEGIPNYDFEYNDKLEEIFNIYINNKQFASDPVQITSFFKTFFNQINETSFLLYIQMFEIPDKTSINYINGQLAEYSHTFNFDENKNGKITYEKDKNFEIKLAENSKFIDIYLGNNILNKVLKKEMKRLVELNSLSKPINQESKKKIKHVVR